MDIQRKPHPAEGKNISSMIKKHSSCPKKQVTVWLLVHTRSPEMSEYFFAGLNDGGASMVLSESYVIAIITSMVLAQTKLYDPSYKQWCYMKHVT